MSLRTLLLVMNYGFMVRILKLNNNLHSGSVQTSHGRKKHVKVGAMSSQCWLFFLIVRVLCTTNLPQEGRQSTKNITLKSWKDCVVPWEENDRVSGQAVTGFFSTITRQRIYRTLCRNFWRNTRFYSFARLNHTLGACGSIKWGLLRRMPRSGWRRIAPTRRYERRSDTFRPHLVCYTDNSYKKMKF